MLAKYEKLCVRGIEDKLDRKEHQKIFNFPVDICISLPFRFLELSDNSSNSFNFRID